MPLKIIDKQSANTNIITLTGLIMDANDVGRIGSSSAAAINDLFDTRGATTDGVCTDGIDGAAGVDAGRFVEESST